MSEKPEALRLVNVSAVLKDLRRQHAEIEVLTAKVKAREDEILTHSEAVYEATKLLSEEREKNERLREALESIAANACCDRCQEAALVAKAALRREETT